MRLKVLHCWSIRCGFSLVVLGVEAYCNIWQQGYTDSDVTTAETSDTACLSTLTAKPIYPDMPDIDMYAPMPSIPCRRDCMTDSVRRRPSSVYVVYPDPTIYDGCGNIADHGGGPSRTETYAIGALSTLQAIEGG